MSYGPLPGPVARIHVRPSSLPPPPPPPPGDEIVLTSVGDSGNGSSYQSVLNLIKSLGSMIHLFLGDFSYSNTLSTIQSWTGKYKTTLPNVSVLGISGNHDENLSGYQSSWGLSYPITGENLVRLFADYPQTNPLVRCIGIVPGVDEIPRDSNYSIGTENYSWTRNAIREAKQRGLWVITFMHKNWCDLDGKGDEVGRDIMELAFVENVDLLLQGHVHMYERSKQWGAPLSGSTTPTIKATGPNYSRGNGTVVIACGTSGASLDHVNSGDPDNFKFADLATGEGGKAAFGQFGALEFRINSARIDGRFHSLNARSIDNFSIQ